jgi:hypothetical protein
MYVCHHYNGCASASCQAAEAEGGTMDNPFAETDAKFDGMTVSMMLLRCNNRRDPWELSTRCPVSPEFEQNMYFEISPGS